VGLRYFNVYGPRESFKGKAASMIYQLALQMKEGKRPRIFEFGEQFRDQIYVKDVVEANLQAMEAPSGVYNVGTGKPTTFNKIVEVLNKVLKTNLEPEYIKNPYTQFYQDQTLADMNLSASKMGFVAKYDIESGIEDYMRWLGFA
jgi:ADP-L-glycero-D-manno-heptose 6-epimerase